jgi:hypothetical protein
MDLEKSDGRCRFKYLFYDAISIAETKIIYCEGKFYNNILFKLYVLFIDNDECYDHDVT